MLHNLFRTIASAMAVLGGIVLTALILLTCLSVLGRGGNTFAHWETLEQGLPALSNWLIASGIGPVKGDFELLEAGVAFAIFAFLPWCQVTGAHASVDIFTSRLPKPANRALTLLWDTIFALALVVIAWRLYDGMAGKMRYGETTFILQFPVWWAYAASFAAASVAAVVGVHVALVRLRELTTGLDIIRAGEAEL
ncbi:TRAP transporter small permease [Pseudooceanicola aestuarii]|uniref:TRAP transporter small permease n=1 Tax=Pseudooceanicola aestuarii TaxID=2697319 RepID=UPI0013D77B17|nr:TRAP transporter small permease [Pseudooceanicola aestuarii]